MQIVDTHQHLWDLELFQYSWLQNVPALNRSFRMDDYLRASAGCDVAKSVHVEADVDEPFMADETRHVLDLAGQPDNPLEGVVACAKPENGDFRSYLEKILGSSKLKGIRRVLHTQPDEVGQRKTFIDNVGSLAGYGLSFDICVLARQLPIAINLVSRCPDVTFVLDHCGAPPVKERIVDPWRSHITALARFPNVSCKISGLVAYADPTAWKADDLLPYVDHVIASFGWDRVMFGSDWPVCTLACTFARWIETLQKITASESEANHRKLFYDNAIRVYRLD